MSYQLKAMNFHGWETLVNREAGYAPYFSSLLSYRVHKKLATNIVVTGEPGIGKSYQAIDLCRALAGLTRSGKDRFTLDQIVFYYKDYMKLIIRLKMGKPIMFDEPSYAMGKREWYKDLNQALVKTIESQRFKVHPLFIPIINKSLLDKTIRTFLVQFQVHVLDRGRAIVYRIHPSQHTDKVYRYTTCQLEYGMFDADRCQRDSCLDCPQLVPRDPAQACQLFRAQYERKKAQIQDVRYGEAYEQAAAKESHQLTEDEMEKRLYDLRADYTDEEGKIDVDRLMLVARRKLEIKVGHNRAYRISKALAMDHPADFSGP